MLPCFHPLPKRKRCSFDYLLLVGLWKSKFVKKVGGSAHMLCGIGPDGKRFNESCYALEMDVLKGEGVPIYLPGPFCHMRFERVPLTAPCLSALCLSLLCASHSQMTSREAWTQSRGSSRLGA